MSNRIRFIPRIRCIVSPQCSKASSKRASIPFSIREASSVSLASDRRAQSPSSRAVAATRKYGEGRKKILLCAAARRKTSFGDVKEYRHDRKSRQVEDRFVKSSMLYRESTRRAKMLRGRVSRDIVSKGDRTGFSCMTFAKEEEGIFSNMHVTLVRSVRTWTKFRSGPCFKRHLLRDFRVLKTNKFLPSSSLHTIKVNRYSFSPQSLGSY